MEPSRVARYVDKLTHAEERLALAMGWSGRARDDLLHRLATYKAIEESAEALADVLAMVAKDLGRSPKDDYSNVDFAEKSGVLSVGAAGALREFHGLRNRLVHEYDRLADQVALDSARRLQPLVRQGVAEVRTWLTSQI